MPKIISAKKQFYDQDLQIDWTIVYSICMARNDKTSEIVDNLLKFVLVSGTISSVLVAPNAMIALEKPLDKIFRNLDKRARERELRRIITYSKSQKLITENYQHGISITGKGKKRLAEFEFENLGIDQPKKWDKVWRIVIFDIPETKRYQRVALTKKLRLLGFYQLQKSTWIHPFPCRPVIEKVTFRYRVNKYISYIEAQKIDNQSQLIKRFKRKFQSINY